MKLGLETFWTFWMRWGFKKNDESDYWHHHGWSGMRWGYHEGLKSSQRAWDENDYHERLGMRLGCREPFGAGRIGDELYWLLRTVSEMREQMDKVHYELVRCMRGMQSPKAPDPNDQNKDGDSDKSTSPISPLSSEMTLTWGFRRLSVRESCLMLEEAQIWMRAVWGDSIELRRNMSISPQTLRSSMRPWASTVKFWKRFSISSWGGEGHQNQKPEAFYSMRIIAMSAWKS